MITIANETIRMTELRCVGVSAAWLRAGRVRLSMRVAKEASAIEASVDADRDAMRVEDLDALDDARELLANMLRRSTKPAGGTKSTTYVERVRSGKHRFRILSHLNMHGTMHTFRTELLRRGLFPPREAYRRIARRATGR